MTWPFGDLPPRSFRAISADPPWSFSGGTKSRPQHYTRMTDRELARLPVEDLAHPEGCWLFLWITSPKLPVAFRLAEAWGFRYSARAFVWIKTERAAAEPLIVFPQDGLHTGTGYTTRKNAEDCLLFRRGAPQRLAADIHEVILSPIREHSRKPDAAYDRIRRFCPGPHLELFSRESRTGWEVFGNEAGKFDAAPLPLAAE